MSVNKWGVVANESKRIASIDALRAFTLLGIFIVHASVMFSFINQNNEYTFISNTGQRIAFIVLSLFQYRCNTIFAMLFGISFYLILRKPQYSSKKFVWRCLILTIFGLINKLFYTNDALMWYGIWGCVLVLFRNFSCKKLFLLSAFFCIISCICSIFDFRCLVFENRDWTMRYFQDSTLSTIIKYPLLSSITDYLYIMFNKPFDALWKFLLGYSIAKAGYIDNIEKYAKNNKLILGLVIAYSLIFCVSFISPIVTQNIFISNLYYLFGAITYALIFLWVYYRFHPYLNFLEPYGKLGLTNYSFQGILGIILTVIVFIPKQWDLQYIIAFCLIIFCVQLVFSTIWLKFFKNGPLEYLWRSLTDLKFSNPLKK